MKRTKIVCTIGPATATSSVMEKLVRAGMNVARLNMSHGTHPDHAKLIRNLHAVGKKTGEPLALLLDLQGPKIRVGDLPRTGITLKTGRDVVFTAGAASKGKIPVSQKNLHRDIKKGERILLDDGLLEVAVKAVRGKDIIARVIVGGLLTSHKGMNFPESNLSLSSLTTKDKKDLRFGLKQGVDLVALSFVRTVRDIRVLRRLAARWGGHKKQPPALIIAKIEKREALKNFDQILVEADGIMVARGDLAVETPAAEVPLHQKTMVQKCLAAGKPVIVATQMLDSMIRNPRPTRAEVSDVANAVIDHADALMLSAETATGSYPVDAVMTQATIAAEVEASVFDDLHLHLEEGSVLPPEAAIAESVGLLARVSRAKAVVGASLTGETGRQISRFRPEIPVYIGTPEERVMRQMNLSWGVRPFLIKKNKRPAALKKSVYLAMKQHRVLKSGDQVIFVSGEPGKKGETNQISLEVVS